MTKLFKNIELLREERHITLRELQDATGISKSTISEWKNEDSSPRISTLEVIASYFDVSIDFLIGRCRNCQSHKDNFSDSTITIMRISETLHLDEKATLIVTNLMISLAETY